MKTRDLTLAAVLGALYVGIGLITPMISFGPFQCRIADALYPLIAVLGYPALVGLAVGHFIYNLFGYVGGFALGLPDVILSPLVFLIPKLFIWKMGLKAVPIHVAAVALWIPILLAAMFGDPLIISIITVGSGEFIAEIIIGIPLAKAVEKVAR